MKRAITFLLSFGFVLSLAPAAQAATPSSDDFQKATDITSLPFTDTVDTTGATLQRGEPTPPCAPRSKTVWYRFKPAQNVHVVGDSSDSSTPTVVGIWSGRAMHRLTYVGCQEDLPSDIEWKFEFDAVAGNTYYIQLGTSLPDGGILRFVFDVEASISGTVRADGGGTLDGICVSAYDALHRYASSGTSTSEGVFRVGGLMTGTYRLHLYDCSHRYLEEWYADADGFAGASTIVAMAGDDTGGIEASLALGASITGTVTDAGTKTPLITSCVSLHDLAGEWVTSACTDETGAYQLAGLVPGSYKLFAYDYDGNHASEWFDDRADFESADVVSLSDAQARTETDVALTPYSGIAGVLTNAADGSALSNGQVMLYDLDYNYVASAYTTDGQYAFKGIAPGSYKVWAWAPGYAEEWYDDKPDFASADIVSVSDSIVGSIDVGLSASAT